MISMDDVARRAGVSKSTVSIVLNKRPGASEEMRQRVLDAAKELGYELPGQRSTGGGGATNAGTTVTTNSITDAPVIALVHCVDEEPDIDEGLTYLYLAYRNGIQRFTQGRDISIMLVTNYRDGNVDSLSYQLLAQQERAFDGFILMGPGLRRKSQLIQRVLDEQTPTVILGRSWPDMSISSVSQDHSEQAHLALAHLRDLGHQHIGFVAREIDRTYDWFHWRLKAYKEVMGIDNDTYQAIDDDLDTAIANLLQQHPEVTALFCLNDHVAYWTMQAAINAGYTVPTNLSVIGIDGVFKPQAGLPQLTTVAFPHEEVGHLAAEILIKQMENRNLRYARLAVRSQLIAGASCASLNV
ncbi:MAG: LacI family DNA-binding transcriptional regulator [Chloroflexota bacterium]